jgi:hypothetical protein
LKKKKVIGSAKLKPDIRPDIRYPALPDIRHDNLVSGQILDTYQKRPDYPDGYPVHPYFCYYKFTEVRNKKNNK